MNLLTDNWIPVELNGEAQRVSLKNIRLTLIQRELSNKPWIFYEKPR
jgi:hypothetical protein